MGRAQRNPSPKAEEETPGRQDTKGTEKNLDFRLYLGVLAPWCFNF
jgi:hypothetical protein